MSIDLFYISSWLWWGRPREMRDLSILGCIMSYL